MLNTDFYFSWNKKNKHKWKRKEIQQSSLNLLSMGWSFNSLIWRADLLTSLRIFLLDGSWRILTYSATLVVIISSIVCKLHTQFAIHAHPTKVGNVPNLLGAQLREILNHKALRNDIIYTWCVIMLKKDMKYYLN